VHSGPVLTELLDCLGQLVGGDLLVAVLVGPLEHGLEPLGDFRGLVGRNGPVLVLVKVLYEHLGTAAWGAPGRLGRR